MARTESDPRFPVEGLLVAIEWDRGGRPRVVALNAPGELQFRIDPSRGVGDLLMKEVGKRLRVWGEIGARGTLIVMGYVVIEDFRPRTDPGVASSTGER
jgi:hypothetical protein